MEGLHNTAEKTEPGSVTFAANHDFVFVCDSQNQSMLQLEIDGISCDNIVTTATILPKGGPPCSLCAGYSDFHQLSWQSLSYTNIPLVPKLLKPLDKEQDIEKK